MFQYPGLLQTGASGTFWMQFVLLAISHFMLLFSLTILSNTVTHRQFKPLRAADSVVSEVTRLRYIK